MFYNDDADVQNIIANCSIHLLYAFLNYSTYYILVSWIGFTYLEAQLPRESNEKVLQNLKIGVIIIE